MKVSTKPPALGCGNILDGLATAVIVFDEDLRALYLNQTAEMLLAVSAKARDWKSADRLDLLSRRRRARADPCSGSRGADH
jgi:nitrogen-specific signal transduction histidine kinase